MNRHDLPPQENVTPQAKHALERRRIFDLGPPLDDPARQAWLALHGGPVEVEGHSVHISEMLERDPARYVEALPDRIEPGPKSGHNAVRHW